MRIVFAILFSITMLGGIGAYIRFADSITPTPIDLSEASASGEYSIDVTLTFDAKVSLFSAIEPVSLQVKFRDQVLLQSSETIPAGTPILIENVADLKIGKNEFWVYVSPGDVGISGSQFSENVFQDLGENPVVTSTEVLVSQLIDRAIRVRVFESGNPVPIAERTIWSDSDGAVQGAIDVSIN